MFLKIPQNSQENICAGLPFAIKVQAGGSLNSGTSLNSESDGGAFLWILQNL